MSAGDQCHQQLIGDMVHSDNDLFNSLQCSLTQLMHALSKLVGICHSHREIHSD
jgi:hypothetical protein